MPTKLKNDDKDKKEHKKKLRDSIEEKDWGAVKSTSPGMTSVDHYSEKEINSAQAVDKKIQEKFRLITGEMLEWAIDVRNFRDAELYLRLGFSYFEDWLEDRQFAKQTVYHRLNILDTYVDKLGIPIKDVAEYDQYKLKYALPLAKSSKATKDSVIDILDAGRNMPAQDYIDMIKEQNRKYDVKTDEDKVKIGDIKVDKLLKPGLYLLNPLPKDRRDMNPKFSRDKLVQLKGIRTQYYASPDTKEVTIVVE